MLISRAKKQWILMKGLSKMNDKYEKMLTVLVVFAVILSVNMANADIVAYQCSDYLNGNLVRDSLGRGDGILKGNPEWIKGKFNGALNFDGDGDYVNCGGGSSLDNLNTWADIKDAITVAAWLNITPVPTSWSAIVTKGSRSIQSREEARLYQMRIKSMTE
jgi:hypothetical protein